MADPRARALTLTAVLVALFVGAFDQTVVAVALPRIAEDLGAADRYAAVATAYLLAATVLVPIYGKLADGGAKHRLLVGAAAVFGAGAVASAGAGLAGPLPLVGGEVEQLIAARAIQGAGGAGLFALATILLAELVPPRARGRYHGLLGAAIGFATLLAPWVGGWLTDHAGAIGGLAGWRWAFLASLPGAVAVAATAAAGARAAGVLGAAPRVRSVRLDAPSALALTGALAALVLALQLDRTDHPWTAPSTLGLLTVAAALAAAFVQRARRVPDPVLRLDTLTRPALAASLPAAAALGAVFLTVVHFVPLYLVQLHGASATAAGLGLIPLSAAAVIAALASGRAASRLGRVKPLMVASMALLVVGALLLAAAIDGRVPLQVALVVLGVAIGAGLPLYTLAAQNAVADARAGEATSASHLARQLGGTVAVAAMGTLMASAFAANVTADGGARDRVPYAIGTTWAAAVEAAVRADAEPAAAAIEAGDVAALLAALEDGALPAEAHTQAVAAAFGAPERRGAAADAVRSQATVAAAAAVAALRDDVEGGFRAGLRAVFGATVWMAATGLIVAAFVPDERLRGRRDRRREAPATVRPRYAPTR